MRTEVLIVALDAVKYHIMRDPNTLMSQKWRKKLFEATLKMFNDKDLKTRVKVKVTELIGALIYLGHVNNLDAESKSSLTRMILDQINQSDIALLPDETSAISMINITDALSSNS